MARKESRTVDFFPHQVNHKKTIKLLKARFKNDGYAVFFQTLEILGKSKDHFFDFSDEIDWLFYVSEMGVSEPECIEILDYCVRLKAFDKDLYEKKILWSDNFVENLIHVYSKRTNDVPVKPITGTETIVTEPETDDSGVDGVGSTQSKVKYSKVKERKESPVFAEPETPNQPSEVPLLELISLWNIECKHLTAIINPSPLLVQSLQARWNDQPDIQWWKDYFFTKFKESDYLKGKVSFVPDFKWCVDVENFGRITTDFYKSRKKGSGDSEKTVAFKHDTCGACPNFYEGCQNKLVKESTKPDDCGEYHFDRNAHLRSFGF